MIFGLRARTCSTSMPIRCRESGSKLVRNTSALANNFISSSRPSGLRVSRPTLRLPRLGCSMKWLTPPAPATMPELINPRWGSPVSGCSILITSAPQSANTAPAAGTNVHAASSTTRMPLRMSVMSSSAGIWLSADRVRDSLGLQVLFESLDAVLAAQTAHLVPTEWRVSPVIHRPVDHQRAGPDTAGHRHRPFRGAHHCAGKPVGRIVGQCDGAVVSTVVWGDGDDWSEDLLLEHPHLRGYVSQNRWCDEVSAFQPIRRRAADGHPRPLLSCAVDAAQNAVALFGRHQRPAEIAGIAGITHGDPGEYRGDDVDRLVVELPRHQHPGGQRTSLPRVNQRGDTAGQRDAHVRVVEHHVGRFTA